jgi:hypothetical protein
LQKKWPSKHRGRGRFEAYVSFMMRGSAARSSLPSQYILVGRGKLFRDKERKMDTQIQI